MRGYQYFNMYGSNHSQLLRTQAALLGQLQGGVLLSNGAPCYGNITLAPINSAASCDNGRKKLAAIPPYLDLIPSVYRERVTVRSNCPRSKNQEQRRTWCWPPRRHPRGRHETREGSMSLLNLNAALLILLGTV